MYEPVDELPSLVSVFLGWRLCNVMVLLPCAISVVWRLCWCRYQGLPTSLSDLSWSIILSSLLAIWSYNTWVLNLTNSAYKKSLHIFWVMHKRHFLLCWGAVMGVLFAIPDQWRAPWDNGTLRCASVVCEELRGSVHGRASGLCAALPLPWSTGYAGLEKWQHGWKWREIIIRYRISLVVFEFTVSLYSNLHCCMFQRRGLYFKFYYCMTPVVLVEYLWCFRCNDTRFCKLFKYTYKYVVLSLNFFLA